MDEWKLFLLLSWLLQHDVCKLLQQYVLIMTIGWKRIVSQNCGERESKCRGLIPWRKSPLDYSSWTDGPVKTVSITWCLRVPHTLLTTTPYAWVETVSISLAPAGVAGLHTHARTMFVWEHHNWKWKPEQSRAVCLRAWQFESESKTRAEKYVWDHGNLKARAWW
jgi:hypothetical protein